MRNQFETLHPYVTQALINDEDKRLIRENLRHNVLVLVGLTGVALVFLIIGLGMSLSNDQTLQGIPVVLVGIFFVSTLGFLGYYIRIRRKWLRFLTQGQKFVWKINFDKVKKSNRRSSQDTRSTRFKSFIYQEMEYEISEDDIGFEQFQKIQQGVDLEFSFTPFYLPYRVEVL
jgi:UDP-N-acetylmuramyl pentapeptide phosphotransferase/UDP-N-acetylglucosamine-1-phosphate transferase